MFEEIAVDHELQILPMLVTEKFTPVLYIAKRLLRYLDSEKSSANSRILLFDINRCV